MGRLSEIVGCRTLWDFWASPSVPVCPSLNDSYRYMEHFFELAYSELKIVTNITGCLTPCTYRKYDIVGEPYTLSTFRKGYTISVYHD